MLVIVVLATLLVAQAALPPTCDSHVYCQGRLLQEVQMARIFNDSKTFVDLKMKYPEQQVLRNFNVLLNATNNKPNKTDLSTFVSNNFEDGLELENWIPPDFTSHPKFTERIYNQEIKNFSLDIVQLWKILSRKVNGKVSENPELYSLLPIPNGFIIPGGRFKEIYYWDSYWIIKGLLLSDMNETARGVIENFLYLVRKYGFVPNGSRVYYTRRSQPPLLTKMTAEYIGATNNLTWLSKNIDALEQELQFWIKNRAVDVKIGSNRYKMYHYNAPTSGPRPESYYEDTITANTTTNPEEIFVNLKSGAESGWDFSSRWIFSENGDNRANLTQIQTNRVIPVDLNAFLYDAFITMSSFQWKLNNPQQGIVWHKRAIDLERAIKNVLWNDRVGVWLDYDLKLKKNRDYFYPSNVAPLWVKCCNSHNSFVIKQVTSYLKKNGISGFPGGIPTSLYNNGEQWDMPNAWPPLQAITIQALQQTKRKEAVDLAKSLADKWIRSNMRGFGRYKEMFEKYDAYNPGEYGGGGEYVVQQGFGWTNGVVLELINMYYTN